MPYISKYGNDDQRKKYIPDMTAGKIVSAIAMTEPDAGRYCMKLTIATDFSYFNFSFVTLLPLSS